MNREDKYIENNPNEPFDTSCTTHPVEVEVTRLHDFLYERENQNLPPSLNSEKKKPGFLKSIFGEKRCKTCSQKKSSCTCKRRVRKKLKVVGRGAVTQTIKCDENQTTFLNSSSYNSSKEIQTNDSCPKKCGLPINQGCGCHLYFCIDSKRKKQPIKSKLNKNKYNENIKTEQEPFTQSFHGEVPNVTIFCDESRDGLDSPNNNIQTINWRNDKAHQSKQTDGASKCDVMERHVTKPFNFSSNEKTIYEFKSDDKNLVDISAINKPSLKDIETNTELSCFNSVPINKTQRMVDNLNEKGNKLYQKETTFKDMHKGLAVFSNFTNNKAETAVSNVKIDLQKSYEHLSKDKAKTPAHSDDDDSSVAKEYSNFARYRKKTRKSTAKSGLFVRNSLVTLRRERRQSEMEERVSLILDKLGNIENKITELEKTHARETEKNVYMGITCEGKQSKVAVKFDDKFCKQVSQNQQNVIGISPLGEKSNKTIRIRSNNESIYLTTPGEVKVVRSKQQEDPSNRSKQLIYENAYEMDAHTIGSNSTTFQCKNPKVVVSYQKPETICKNPNCTGKWRRISEELKQSNLDFVKCDSHVCKK